MFESFLKASKDNVHFESMVDQTKIFKLLVEKVVNTWFSEELRAYKEEYTRLEKNKKNNLTVRCQLDSFAKGMKQEQEQR